MFTVVCDNCGADSNEGEEYSAWNVKSFAEDCAIEGGWLKEGDRHYCGNCFSYGDNDELKIDESRTLI